MVKGLWKWDQGQVAFKMRSRSDDFENEIKVRWLWKWDQGQMTMKMRSRSDDFENEIKVRWLWKWDQGQVALKMRSRSGGFDLILMNISAISWWPVLVVEEAGVPGENHCHIGANRVHPFVIYKAGCEPKPYWW